MKKNLPDFSNENVQVGMLISGFFILFALLALFFF